MRNCKADTILEVLDRCCESFTFPMLDNGYVYLAATRLSLYRWETEWGIVIEVFGFSPRSGLPDTYVHTFSNHLHARKARGDFVDAKAYEQYLSNNPHNESSLLFPIEDGDWIDAEDPEMVAPGQCEIVVRGQARLLPTGEDYVRAGVVQSRAPRTAVFELCRALALTAREHVLATASERSTHLAPELQQILQLEEWNHPDISGRAHRPSNSETFKQIAEVLVTGDVDRYEPTGASNTHWSNWPEGGTL